MEKKLVEVLGLREMEYDNIAKFKEGQRETYEKTNEYLLKEYGYDLEHFINCALGWVWDEMSWGIDMSEEEGEENE